MTDIIPNEELFCDECNMSCQHDVGPEFATCLYCGSVCDIPESEDVVRGESAEEPGQIDIPQH